MKVSAKFPLRIVFLSFNDGWRIDVIKSQMAASENCGNFARKPFALSAFPTFPLKPFSSLFFRSISVIQRAPQGRHSVPATSSRFQQHVSAPDSPGLITDRFPPPRLQQHHHKFHRRILRPSHRLSASPSRRRRPNTFRWQTRKTKDATTKRKK